MFTKNNFLLIEYTLGIFNASFGIIMVLYVSRSLSNYKVQDKKLYKIISHASSAILFLALFSSFHFLREVFELKSKYGSIAEIPEYFIICAVYINLLLIIVFYDAPDNI